MERFLGPESAAARPGAAAGQLTRAAWLFRKAPKGVIAGAVFFILPGVIASSSVRHALAGGATSYAENSGAPRAGASQADLRDDASPWGVAVGSEWFADYPKFNPLLHDAGINWLRGFPPWHGIEPQPGEWNWAKSDALVANARANNIHLTAPLAYLAPWASAQGDPRKFPIKDMQFWRDFVAGVVDRYHKDIKYWEIWNEFNGGFAVNGTPEIYAGLVRDAYDEAKKIDPEAKIGMNVANFDVGFLDRAIKAGAADHFDYLAVHPYEILGGVADGGEAYFLSMADNLRRMLAANGQRADMPLWITEIGALAPVAPEPSGDELQASTLAKAYILSLAAGFERVFWFEARGPAYKRGLDHGLIRADWSLRPSYEALKTIIGALGRHPRYLGWLELGKDELGFLFQGQSEAVLAAWSRGQGESKLILGADARVTNLAGERSGLKAGNELILTATPLLITQAPAGWAAEAKRNAGKPLASDNGYPGGGTVSCRLQANNIDGGLRQIEPESTVPADVDGVPARRMDFTRPNATGRYALFHADPQFASYGTKDLEITAVVRRAAPDQNAGLNLEYESLKGFVGAPAWFTIPADDQWHEVTWRVADANFVGAWGYNFRLNAISSPNEFYIKEVRMKKLALRP
jgi:polysaccharide biosynthesis protein PslG